MLETLKLDLQRLRIREFSFGGNTFRVLMPISGELDLIMKRIAEPSEALRKEVIGEEKNPDADAVKKAASTASYILESWNLLCNEEGVRVVTTYAELNKLVPFAVQIEVAKLVIELLAPNWSDERKN